jgi:hypothetical protein
MRNPLQLILTSGTLSLFNSLTCGSYILSLLLSFSNASKFNDHPSSSQSQSPESKDGTSIPEIVKSKITHHNTYLLAYPDFPDSLHDSWPEFIYSCKVPRHELKTMVNLFCYKLGRGKELIFHGDGQVYIWEHALEYGQRVQWGPVRHEFSNGIYYTPDLELAIQYVRSGGILVVVDWSGHGGTLKVKYLAERNGEDEWATLVKRSVCYGTSFGIIPVPKHPDDFLVGPVSANNSSVARCSRPIKGSETQIVAKTDGACAYMARNTLAVFYVL